MSEKTIEQPKTASMGQTPSNEQGTIHDDAQGRGNRKWWHGIKEPGHALQIVVAAIVAIAIGLAVTNTVDEVPPAASAIIAIPGTLWLRALKAVVLPLIICAIILAVQRLREMSTGGGGVLARWTIGYYVLTTLLAIVHSTIVVSLGWVRLMTVMDPEDLAAMDSDTATEKKEAAAEIHEVVVQMFESFIPSNIAKALAEDSLLAVLVTSVVVGYLLKPTSPLLKVVKEIEDIITAVITWLIKVAPIGVFFLIMPNLFRLKIAEIGQNLGILIASALAGMGFHLFVVIPLIFYLILRKNPYVYWFASSSAWITAWGTASSAATLSVTMKCARNRGIPESIVKFVVPLGCLINMDGTAIYFPCVVVFLAATQGQSLNGADYVIICLLSTLASIGTTPIPSSSLVLTVMIAESVDIEVTGMFAVVVAIDWFLDRFRTAVNVSGDLYAAAVLQKLSGITEDDDESSGTEAEVITDNSQRV
ncbi:hypothetical protein VTK26DRAFT_3315 [Humicola hyalothermophila]